MVFQCALLRGLRLPATPGPAFAPAMSHHDVLPSSLQLYLHLELARASRRSTGRAPAATSGGSYTIASYPGTSSQARCGSGPPGIIRPSRRRLLLCVSPCCVGSCSSTQHASPRRREGAVGSTGTSPPPARSASSAADGADGAAGTGSALPVESGSAGARRYKRGGRLFR